MSTAEERERRQRLIERAFEFGVDIDKLVEALPALGEFIDHGILIKPADAPAPTENVPEPVPAAAAADVPRKDRAAAMVAMLKAGHSVGTVAEHFGVTPAAIYQARKKALAAVQP